MKRIAGIALGLGGIAAITACSPTDFQYGGSPLGSRGGSVQVSAAATNDDGYGSRFKAIAGCRSDWGSFRWVESPWEDVNDSGRNWNGRWYAFANCAGHETLEVRNIQRG